MVKINEIDPGAENIRFIAKVLSATLVNNNKGNNVRCQLGDETGVVNAFLGENENLVVGKTVALFGAEAKVVREHIEIQRARVEPGRNPIDKVNDKFNISEKAWVPVD